MKTAIALRHLAFEDAGILGSVLMERGITLRYVDVAIDDLSQLDNTQIDLLLILGGPISVNDGALFPFLASELALIKQRLELGLPTLGLCLGAQLIAKALGANIYPGKQAEIGWYPLRLSSSAQYSPVKHLSSAMTTMFHWHGETFDLPAGATLLASSDRYENQIFSWGEKVMAVQCHPEVFTASLEHWFVGHICELSKSGLSVMALREASTHYGPQLEQQAHLFFTDWLESIGL